MVEIQPFKFQKSTNIEEHNQMKDKINEMVEVINGIDLENLPSQIDALETEVATQGNEIDALEVAVDAIPDTYAKKTDIPDVSDFITADALTPYAKIVNVDNADVTGVDATINNGEITIKLTRPDGDMSDSIDCPFIQTATLIPTSTARAFKIRFTYTDGTQYDTNEFVIPEGGGTDVSVTGVTVGDGTAPNSFKVAIQLSDTTTIGSNDYAIEFPEYTNTYPTTLTATLNGTTLNMTIGLNDSSTVKGTADLSGLLTNYATESYVDTQVATKLDKTTADGYYQPKGNYLTAVPIGGTTIGGVKNGGNVTIDAQGNMNAPTTPAYTLPVASPTTLGGVKIGSGVTVGADGTISVNGGNVSYTEISDIETLKSSLSLEKMIGVSLRSNSRNTYADLIIFPFDVNLTSRIVKRCSGVAIQNANIVFVYDIDVFNGELTINDETGNTILNGSDIDRVQGFIVN